MRLLQTTGLVCGVACLGLAACVSVEHREQEQAAAPGSPGVVASSEEAVEPVESGQRAPAARVRDTDGVAVPISSVYARGPTVLIFYRGGWCPFCTEHMSEVAHEAETLKDMGFQIVGVSPDSPQRLAEGMGDQDPGYTLLSDSSMSLSRAFGLAFKVDEQTRDALREMGMDLAEHSGRTHGMLPVPAVYLIDREGMIRFAHWDTDYRQRLSVEDLLSAAEQMGS